MRKTLFLSLLLILSAISLRADPAYFAIEEKSGLEVKTPALQKRQTAKIRLANGLEAYLISDPETIQSGAAIAVEVGSFDDLEKGFGTAHFVEHMLFLGTEKYPDEEDFARFLDNNGGNHNAFTTNDKTVFSFAVANHAFSAALDRLACFFISPLFSPSGLSRESIAVDEEFRKNIPIDIWRVLQVKKELSNPSHPFRRFSIGNEATLKAIPREELVAWYKEHYSSNLMHLFAISPLPLDEMISVVTTAFSSIQNHHRTPEVFDYPISASSEERSLIVVAAQQETKNLELTWELPRELAKNITCKPDQLITYILGHEGEFTLLSALKKEQLATGLGAGNSCVGRDNFFFTLSIDLTSKGVKEYETVIKRCYEAIAFLSSQGIPKYLYDEIRELTMLKYLYQPRENIFEQVTKIAAQLPDEPLDTYPLKTLMPTEYDPSLITAFLKELTPSHCHYILTVPASLTKVKKWKKEEWMGVEYALLPLSKQKLTAWSNLTPHPTIGLPAPNKFVPSTLQLVHDASEKKSLLPHPSLLVSNPKGECYYCQDDRFHVPEIAYLFHICTPAISEENPQLKAMADLYCHFVTDQLNSVCYEASLAGLSYALVPFHQGYKLEIRGYDERAPVLLGKILATLKEPVITPQLFTLYKEKLSQEYFNTANASPLKQGSELLFMLLYKDFSGPSTKREVLENLSFEEFSSFCSRLWEKCYVKGSIYGNIEKESAEATWAQLEQAFASSLPYPSTEHLALALAHFPSAFNPRSLIKESSLEGNALIMAADLGEFSFETRTLQELLSKGLEEPFFTELRTKKQMGYIVFNEAKEMNKHLYLFFGVQSSTYKTRDLLTHCDAFFQDALHSFSSSTIPESRFAALKQALITKIEHPADNIAEINRILHTLAFEYEGNFDFTQQWKDQVDAHTYAQFQTYAHEFLAKGLKMAICIEGDCPKKNNGEEKLRKCLSSLRNQISYKKANSSYKE